MAKASVGKANAYEVLCRMADERGWHVRLTVTPSPSEEPTHGAMVDRTLDQLVVEHPETCHRHAVKTRGLVAVAAADLLGRLDWAV